MPKQLNDRPSLTTILKISGAFIAFQIGPTFSSGQEPMQYFVVHGLGSIPASAIVLTLLMYLCYSFLRLGKNKGLTRNEDIFRHYCGKHLGTVISWYTMILIVAVHALMLSGTGATLEQSYGIPRIVGSGLMALASMCTILLGLKRIVDIISGVGPIIVIVTLFIAVATLTNHHNDIAANTKIIPELEMMSISSHWFSSAIMYVGMSILGLACFITPLGRNVDPGKNMLYSAIGGPLFFSVALVTLCLALISSISTTHGEMIPTLALATNVLPIYGSIFAIIIFFGIYTSATPLLWTVCARFAEDKTKKYNILVVILTLIGWFGGMTLPFDKLVNLIHPTIAVAGVIFIVCALWTDCREYLTKVKNPS